MRYNRQESLRYTLKNPPPAKFKIFQIEDNPVHTSVGDGHVLNLSPNGLLLSTNLKMPFHKKVRVIIMATFLNTAVEWKAEIVWGKEKGSTYHYGLTLLDDHSKEIIRILKQYKANESTS
ncbi:PilZ domain-containing protein [Halobacillus sp. A1]|uniref:PilZ domain-containing protein n=1 Tax=Halobacillus sp. A1 TaxID=2880262 RepID=UPI0020A676A5|nr:PilZ domain-containing protein [Halobacillus sp. A1]MCP3030208.1 PilZ domain-containing protein [Halobacillus sp. A1]